MASPAMHGAQIGCLFADHTLKNKPYANVSTIFAPYWLSSCSDCSRCRWNTHLTNHDYFHYGKNLMTSNLSPCQHARIKMVLGSPLYIRGHVVQFARKLEEELSLYLTTFDYLPFSFFFRKKILKLNGHNEYTLESTAPDETIRSTSKWSASKWFIIPKTLKIQTRVGWSQMRSIYAQPIPLSLTWYYLHLAACLLVFLTVNVASIISWNCSMLKAFEPLFPLRIGQLCNLQNRNRIL